MGANINLGLLQQHFFFIRHGQTDWNQQKIAMGQADVPLNRRGEEEARQAARILREHGITRICHSPLKRARITAQLIADELALPCEEIAALSQCNWGVMQGQPRGDEAWRMAWRRGEIEIEGAETFNEFCHRVRNGINQALAHGEPALIVAHGATFAVIQRELRLEDREMQNCLPLRYRPPTTGEANWQVTELTEFPQFELVS
ncbi:MAG: histidine phosphatase family protein [Chitinivorax sp.]